MTIPYNKIYVRHLVQSNAKQVFDYCATIPVLKKDKYNFLYIGIKDCINFNAIITSNYTIYDEYVRTTNQKEHSVATFKKLIQEWDLSKMNPIELAYDGVDFNILDKGCNHNTSKAYKMALRATHKHSHGTRRVPKSKYIKK